jgi:hypothetical protein
LLPAGNNALSGRLPEYPSLTSISKSTLFAASRGPSFSRMALSPLRAFALRCDPKHRPWRTSRPSIVQVAGKVRHHPHRPRLF